VKQDRFLASKYYLRKIARLPSLVRLLSLSSLAITVTLVVFAQIQQAQSRNLVTSSSVKSDRLLQLQQIAKQTTVRIVKTKAAGSGAIIAKKDNIYTVITNWHVVDSKDNFTIITTDAKEHQILNSPKQLGNKDLALIQFQSRDTYETTKISRQLPVVGEFVYASGFPLYYPKSLQTTLDLGIKAFRFTQGKVSLILPKSLPEGYLLGYTNDIQIGMSGGPIFNEQGLLIGINGRSKERDPGFGVYTFEDGSEPSPKMLEQMVNSSLGIPITTYLKSVPNPSRQDDFKLINPMSDMW
jgi:serine protease Do